jgi:hypothetical protein
MEERLIVFTPEKIKDDIKKLCQKINSDIFKKESVKLKDMLLHDGNNLEALIKYNNLIKKAKEMKIV